jgi:hypothetical protein
MPASLGPVVSPMRHARHSDNVNDDSDGYLLPINKLMDCMSFGEKQQLDILFEMSQSAYFGTHSLLRLYESRTLVLKPTGE